MHILFFIKIVIKQHYNIIHKYLELNIFKRKRRPISLLFIYTFNHSMYTITNYKMINRD